jgi:hypothetical protein
MMCLWYDCGTTLQAMGAANRTDWLMTKIFEVVMDLSEDFEVKRFMLGLSSLLAPIEMPTAVANNYGNVMKALVYLSQKSCEIYEKSQ